VVGPVAGRWSILGGCAFAQPGGIGFEDLSDIVPHASELRHHLLLAALGVRGVIEAPVMAIHLPGIEGARLVGVAADSDYGHNLAVEKSVHVLRCVVGNVNPDLFQYLNRLGVDEADGFRPPAVHIDKVPGGCTEDAFSHVAAAGIPGAKDKDVGRHNELCRVAID
jgi:hypothetical protein